MLRRNATLLLLCAAITGCGGFKLAGSPGGLPAIEQQTLQVTGGGSEFRYALLRGLRNSGIAVTAQDAQLIVHLGGPDYRQKVIAVDERFDAREYELIMHLTVRLQVPGEEQSAPVTLSRSRIWFFDADRYIAADEEREVLEQEIRAELIDALMRHIQAHG